MVEDLLAAVDLLKAARNQDAEAARPGSDFQARALSRVAAAYDLSQDLQQQIYEPQREALCSRW
jgi:hypothetical protein